MENSLLSGSSSSPEPLDLAQVSSTGLSSTPMVASTGSSDSTTATAAKSSRTDFKASSRQCSTSTRCHGVGGYSGDSCSSPTSLASSTAPQSLEFGLFQFWRTPLPNIQELEVEGHNDETSVDGVPGTDTIISEGSVSLDLDDPAAIVNSVLQAALRKIKAEASTGLTMGGANNIIRYNQLDQGSSHQGCQGEEEEEDEEKEMLTDIKDELLAESESAELELNLSGLAEDSGLARGGEGVTVLLPADEQQAKCNGFPPVSSSLHTCVCVSHCCTLPEIHPSLFG